jgi:hypothetical protein
MLRKYLIYMVLLYKGPEFNKDCWFSVKEKLGLTFPNVSSLFELKLPLGQFFVGVEITKSLCFNEKQ